MGLREKTRELKERYKHLAAEYGKIAIITWFALFALTWLGFWAALSLGWSTDGAAAGAGRVGVAYGLTQVVKIPRIIAVLALTPIVARFLRMPKKNAPTEPAKAEVAD